MACELLFTTLALAMAFADASPKVSSFRWPFHPSPFVVANNPRDGLPDFTYFDAINASLTAHTIACPAEMQKPCSNDTITHDEGCGSDGLHGCKGGLYCDISHHNMKGSNLTGAYFPHFTGKATSTKAVPRTRRNILQRAIGWLAVHAPYFGCRVPKFKYDGMEMCAVDDDPLCPQFTYTLTCEGLISMAYGTPGYGGSPTEHIPYSELQPGDAITEEKYKDGKHAGTSHFLMFREWVQVNKTARAYQMGGNHGDTNMVILDNIGWCVDKIPRTGGCKGSKKYKNIRAEEQATTELV